MRATYYSAPWCQPCKTFKPIALKAIVDADIEFVERDVEVDHEWAAADNVMSLPTIVFDTSNPDNGFIEEYARVVGASTKQLKEALDKSKEYMV